VSNSRHNITFRKIWLLLIISAFCVTAVLVVTGFSNAAHPNYTVVKDIEYLNTEDRQVSISKVLNTPDNMWGQISGDLTSSNLINELHWFRFTISDFNSTRLKLLEINNVLSDNVNFWFVQDNQILENNQIDDSFSITQYGKILFPIPTNKQPLIVYVSAYSKSAADITLNIWQQVDYLKFISKNNIITGIFFGLMLAMGLSNLFFYITTRTPTFLVYAGYVMFLALTLAALQGLGYRYIWSDSAWLQQNAVGIYANLTVCLSIIFCDLLLDVRAYSTRLSKSLNVIAGAFLIGLIFNLFIPSAIFPNVFLVMLCVSGILVLSVSIWLWIKGLAIARYYSFAWTVLFIGVLTESVDTLNMSNLNLHSYYLLMLCAGTETILLALILAISHNKQRQTLLDTQVELLNQERRTQHTQQVMLALQENTTEELEYKVQERTLELEVALRELSDTNRELHEKNTLDALTGIRNRRYFNKKYQAEIRRSRRERTQLSVVMIDIDHFKHVNDRYGHLVGDECIRAVAHILKKALKRSSDDVCRYGGEEFALVLPCTDLEGALILVEQLRVKIEKTTIHADDASVNITISAGIGTAVADFTQPEDNILALADKQLYAAKNAGRNNVQGSHLELIQQQD
jgi:diguanylate cyclase (GGDEF)-like protein